MALAQPALLAEWFSVADSSSMHAVWTLRGMQGHSGQGLWLYQATDCTTTRGQLTILRSSRALPSLGSACRWPIIAVTVLG